MFSEENVPAKIVNPAIQAMKVVQAEMAGEAEKANLIFEEDVLQFVKKYGILKNRSFFPTNKIV